jgi:hypothetical protein
MEKEMRRLRGGFGAPLEEKETDRAGDTGGGGDTGKDGVIQVGVKKAELETRRLREVSLRRNSRK